MAKKPMPSIDTEEEFANFLDNYDTADYWDKFEDIKDVKIKRPKKKAITIRLYPYLIAETKKFAARRGIPYQTLIGQWIAECLSQEKRS